MDPLIYRCGFSIEKYDKELDILNVEPVHHAYYNMNHMIQKCIDLSECDNIHGYLTESGKGNFRFDVYPYYKENRVKCKEECGNPHPYDCNEHEGHELVGAKPVYYSELREFLQKRWKAEMVIGQEADDACSIKQYELNSLGFDKDIHNSIIWTIDKDLNNVPGWHGNLVSGEIYYVEEIQALRNFYLQILTGDSSDGIPRIKKGWKKKEVYDQIAKCKTEKEMQEIVYNEIHKVLHSPLETVLTEEQNAAILKEMTWRGQLVNMRKFPGEMWTPNLI